MQNSPAPFSSRCARAFARREAVVCRQRRTGRADRPAASQHRHRRGLGGANRRIFAGRIPRRRVRSARLGQKRGRSKLRSAARQHCRRSRRIGRSSRARSSFTCSASPAAVSPHLDYAAWRPERLRSLVVGASTGAIADKEIADFIERIAIPDIRKQSAHYRELGPSYRGANPEGTKRWIEIDEHARQPGAGFPAAAAHPEYLGENCDHSNPDARYRRRRRSAWRRRP